MCMYCRERCVYPSDVIDQEWAILELLIFAVKPGGRAPEIERRDLRVSVGREPEPSAAIVDSQSIKTSSARTSASV